MNHCGISHSTVHWLPMLPPRLAERALHPGKLMRISAPQPRVCGVDLYDQTS
jgi:hypothetical protein